MKHFAWIAVMGFAVVLPISGGPGMIYKEELWRNFDVQPLYGLAGMAIAAGVALYGAYLKSEIDHERIGREHKADLSMPYNG